MEVERQLLLLELDLESDADAILNMYLQEWRRQTGQWWSASIAGNRHRGERGWRTNNECRIRRESSRQATRGPGRTWTCFKKKKPENSAIVTELEAGEEAMEEELTAVSDNREEEENAEISARGSSEHDNRNAVPTTPRLSASVFWRQGVSDALNYIFRQGPASATMLEISVASRVAKKVLCNVKQYDM